MTAGFRCKERMMTVSEFEKDLDRLENITKKLSTGELGIEKSMALYSEGNQLAGQLRKKLDAYQSKIKILEDEVTDK